MLLNRSRQVDNWNSSTGEHPLIKGETLGSIPAPDAVENTGSIQADRDRERYLVKGMFDVTAYVCKKKGLYHEECQ